MACVKMMLFALFLPCAGADHDSGASQTKCTRHQVQVAQVQTSQPTGRGFAYALY